MTSIFDSVIDRLHSDSIKWRQFPEDVLPMWVADMDFATPAPIMEAIKKHMEQKVLGYGIDQPELKEVIAGRMQSLYQWTVTPEEITFIPGIVPGFNLAAAAAAKPGGEILIQTPVYPPFHGVAGNNQMIQKENPLIREKDYSYSVDFQQFQQQADSNTSIFILCNPENPVGRAFSPAELKQMADLCLKNQTIICSDEIHCDLLKPGVKHTPIASLSPEISQSCITLMSPSKTFNMPGLFFAFAVIQNEDLRMKFINAAQGKTGHMNILSQPAAYAAYTQCNDWLEECLLYTDENCKYLTEWLASEIPQLKVTPSEATYLAWIDCRELELNTSPAKFFLEHGKVAFNAGESFGPGGEGFIRLNFGCPRSTLREGLKRMTKAIKG